jgi:hypothetical protein
MQSIASRKLRSAGLKVVGCYFVLFAIADYVAIRVHPAGVSLWLLALLPVLPLVLVIMLMGRYLREERDEYKRDLMVRCVLWGSAGAMAVNFFVGFLRIFGWKGQTFPFIEFFVFALLMIAAKLTYRVANPTPADE